MQKSKGEVRQMFDEAIQAGVVKHYKKIGKIIFRSAVPGETIITTCGGKVETLKTCAADEIIVQNIIPGGSAETYCIAGPVFKKRYEPTGNFYAINGQRWESAVASGEIDAFEYGGEPITFMAPWGQPMAMEPGDMLCCTGDPNDIYRIARAEFDKTYEFVADVKAAADTMVGKAMRLAQSVVQ